jgi:diaminopimelate epimerase
MADNFTVMSGAGNSFAVVDNRKGGVRNRTTAARKICRAKGLDGTLFIENSRSAPFMMKIINADGSEAEMCGNGSRCAALYALDRRIVPSPDFSFETLAGIIHANVGKDGNVRVKLTEPYDFRERIRLDIEGLPDEISFINTGVPHAVVLLKDVRRVDVRRFGKIIRNHPYFGPAGTNANFVSVRGAHDISVRTYERGVENETKACGTGSTASALIAAWHGLTKPPVVNVSTSGGEVLRVHFDRDLRDVRLEGKVIYLQG